MVHVRRWKEGSTVRSISEPGLRHTVTPTGHGEFASGEANTRGTLILEHKFLTPGRYGYPCEVHWALGMQGTIFVTP